jgi:integrase
MSTIWRDKNTRRWVGEMSLGTIGGKRQRKRVYGRTKREVEAKLRQLEQEQARGRDLAAPRQTVAETLKYWIEHVAVDQADSSRAAYQRDIDLRIIPQLGHIHIDQLQPQDVQTWQNGLGQHYSAATVVRTRFVLYAALQQAWVWGHVSRNVVALVRGPRLARSPVEPLTEEQARRLLAELAGHRQEAFTVLLVV